MRKREENTKTWNSKEFIPYIYYRTKTPPWVNVHNSTFNSLQQKTMRKIQNLALIKAIEITDGLAAYNEENDTLRARLIFAYDSGEDNGDDDVLALLTTLTSSNQYSLIINLDNLPNTDGLNDDQVVEKAKELLVGKKTTFTTYIFPIAELNENGETHVHNTNGRVYSSFSNSYLGKMDDEESAKNSILSRLNNGLSNGEYEFGQEIAQQAPQQRVRMR